jgi:hypothetical protein
MEVLLLRPDTGTRIRRQHPLFERFMSRLAQEFQEATIL